MSDHDLDSLGVTEDAHTLADFISARSIEPPLSIGIFGREGTGKSFFARIVSQRLDEISKSATEAKRNQRDTALCSNIVQVHYNAWHNSGTNPWISLTEAVITQIDVWTQKTNFNTNRFLSVRTAQKLLQKYILEVNKWAILVDQARRSLSEAEGQYHAAVNELAQIQSADEWSAVAKKLGQEWVNNPGREKLGQTLGIQFISRKPEQHQNVLNEGKSLGGRAGLITNSLITRKYVGNFLLIIFVLVLLIVAGYLANNLRSTSETMKDWLELINNISTVITFLVTFLGIVVGLILRQQAANAIDKLYEDEQALDEAHRSVVQDLKIRGTIAQQKVNVWQKETENRRSRLAEAEGNYLLAQQALDDFKSGNILKSISDYYRSQILASVEEFQPGFIPIIRDDFYDISSIMGDLRYSSDFDRAPEDFGVERIVIFIDDLDQSPPETNLAMLQVAHLLLAYPLFVAVFIVDPLKLLRLLQPHYLSLAAEGNDRDDDTLMAQNEVDYLSKFIQIPYWVRTIGHQGLNYFVRSMFAQESEATPPILPTDKIGPFVADTPLSSESEPVPLELPTAAVTIKPIETDFIIQMAEIIGQSPRHVKRFINGYEFIQIAQYRKRMRDMTEADDLLPSYMAVLSQLAIVVAMPTAALYYFKILDESAAHSYTFSKFLNEIEKNAMIKETGSWPRIQAILDPLSRFGDAEQIVYDLHNWSVEVKLLSYNIPPTVSR